MENLKTTPDRSADSALSFERYGIVGMGRSGIAAAELLLSFDKKITLLDDRDLGEDEIVKTLLAKGAMGPLLLSDSPEVSSTHDELDALIVSPGVSVNHPLLVEAAARGIQLISEIELGWEAAPPGRTVAVTGTNGKTTVTSLIAHMVRVAGSEGIEVGNIGNPFCRVALERKGDSDTNLVYATEVSSFQFETVRRFRPEVAVLLNITPDHLDRHGTMDTYAEMKARITQNQNADDHLIVNQDDIRCIEIGESSQAQVLRFSLERAAEAGAWLDDDRLVLGHPGQKVRRIIDLEELPLPGMHNVANYLAAACAGMALGINRKVMAEAFRSFPGVPHRLEHVATIDGVEFYNDSKATNVDSMRKAIESFSAPILLIAGGRDKGGPFASAARMVGDRVKKAYLIGEAAAQIESVWSGHVESEQCADLARALARAASDAQEGEIVLLSPGCASFDQFTSYEERGKVFSDLARRLPQSPVAPVETVER